MCTNCLSTVEATASVIAVAGYAVRPHVRRVLAAAGLVAEPDPVAHDVVAVRFLRSLDLDPIAILGAATVAAAETWRPQPAKDSGVRRRLASARPIGSQSLAITQ